MKEHKARLELFKQCTGKVVVQTPVIRIPSQGFWVSKVKEYYR